MSISHYLGNCSTGTMNERISYGIYACIVIPSILRRTDQSLIPQTPHVATLENSLEPAGV